LGIEQGSQDDPDDFAAARLALRKAIAHFDEGAVSRDECGRFAEGKPQFEKLSLGKAEKWLVDAARDAGLDIGGFEHEITNEFVNHVINHHGNAKTEAARGLVAIGTEDFLRIPDVIRSPDFAIIGARRRGGDFMIYAKEMEDGTTLYLEEVLSGRNNRTLRGKTMYKFAGIPDVETMVSIITNRDKTDISKAKMIVGTGSQPGDKAVETI